VEALEKGDKSRVAIKAEALKKKKASKVKKTKRKYRELEAKGKKVDMEEEDEVEIIWDDEVVEGGKESEIVDKAEGEGKSDVKPEVKPEESGKSV
jgi:hypothetical protein